MNETLTAVVRVLEEGSPELKVAASQILGELSPQEPAVVQALASHLTLGDNTDAVLVPNPAYPIHPFGFVIAGADVRHIPIGQGLDFFEGLETAFKNSWPRPKFLLLNFPSNPTTQCVDLPFFERVIDFARENNIWVVQDLAYADIVFDGYKAPSILQVKGAKDIAVEFFTMSKSYNMPGWRIGFMVGSPVLVKALARLKSYLDYGMFTPVQVAAITECPAGDLNDDGAVDLSDLAILLAHFGTPSGAVWPDGDLDADGDVDIQDLATILANFGSICL